MKNQILSFDKKLVILFSLTFIGSFIVLYFDLFNSRKTTSTSTSTAIQSETVKIEEKKIQLPPKKVQSISADVAAQIIEKNKPVQLAVPVLVESHIKLRAVKSSKLIYWEKVEHADCYVVTVYDLNNPKEIFFKSETEKNFFEFKTDIGSKNYRFEVEAHANQKNFINSLAAEGTIELIFNPIVITELEKNKVMKAKTSLQPAEPEDFNITWQKTPKSRYYKIDFYTDDQSKKTITTIKAFTNNIKITMNNFGRQYYKVSAFNRYNEQIAQSAIDGKISYEKEFLLNKPSIEESSKNLSYFFQNTEGRFIRISWKNLQKEIAPHHYIEVSRTEDFKNLINTYKTDNLSLQIDESIPSGKYYWRVKAYSENIISDWSDTATIKIQSVRAISTISNGDDNTVNKDNKSQQNK